MDQVRYPFKRSWRWQVVRFFDWIFDLFSKQAKAKPFPSSIQNILVVRLDHIGDLTCSLPAISILKKQYPNARLSLLTGKEGEAILAQNPNVDEIIVFRSNWFARGIFFNPFEFVKLVWNLRKKAFDLGFDLRGDLRNIVLMALAGVRYRIAYGIAGGSGLLDRTGVYDTALHQVELNAKLVTEEVFTKTDLVPKIFLGEAEIGEALQTLKNLGARSGTKLIAIHPEAGYPSKEWEEEKFVVLIHRFLRESRDTILIFGVSKARQLAEHFAHSARVINLVGKCSLRQMVALLSHCHLFIGNDSGPSHLAQTLDIPIVVIASGTNEYDQWGVWAKDAQVLKHAVPCSPCHLKYCNVLGHPCMSHISAEEVFEEAQRQLTRVLQ
ncbi:MAG: glycosyltransferase family 9 protein [Candidatus Omnitrophica bacterium]|nr:glycosyltransferase family 9 protein [Candidatus Omnitrophota bacterium]